MEHDGTVIPEALHAGLGVGQIYEDCAFHPVLCTELLVDDDEMIGISLIDGSWPSGTFLVSSILNALSGDVTPTDLGFLGVSSGAKGFDCV